MHTLGHQSHVASQLARPVPARISRARQPGARSQGTRSSYRKSSRQQRPIQCFKSSSEAEVSQVSTAPSQKVKTSSLVSNGGTKQPLTVSWAGAGIFFFWQLGAMKYLAEQYDLTKVPMVGASGGALAAVLAGCGVNADRVIERAYELSLQHNIWQRPLGLLGIWGSLIEQWLDELLPANAHEMCRNRITVVVTTLPAWTQVGITDFKDKRDLINACMASAHIPFFLDFKLARTCRGKQCVDGSFPDFFTGLNSELLTTPSPGASAVVFDYFDDKQLTRKGRMDMLEVKSYDEVRRMYELGYQYAAKLHEQDRFAHYDLAEIMLQGEGGHMSEVLVPDQGNGQTQGAAAAAAGHLAAVAAAAGQANGTSNGNGSSQLQRTGSESRPHGLVLELQQDGQELAEKLYLRSGRSQQDQDRDRFFVQPYDRMDAAFECDSDGETVFVPVQQSSRRHQAAASVQDTAASKDQAPSPARHMKQSLQEGNNGPAGVEDGKPKQPSTVRKAVELLTSVVRRRS